MPPANRPNLTRTGTASKTKGYTRVVFIQGVPVLDTDLNDAQAFRGWEAEARAAIEFGAPVPEAGPRAISQWLPMPVDRANGGENDRNKYNFAVSVGRLATRLGVVDTFAMHDPAKMPALVFDYKRLLDEDAELDTDHEYPNYLYRGTATAVTSDELTDENKVFSAARLLGTSAEAGGVKTVITDSYNDGDAAPDLGAQLNQVAKHEYRLKENAARVIMLTGANAGTERLINTVPSETTVGLSSDFDEEVQIGDEYVIVPANMLVDLRTIYNAADKDASHPSLGLASEVPYCVIYVQTWEEDISTEEDDELILPALARATSHRTQLRWCVRTALMWESIDSDVARDAFRPGHMRWLYDAMSANPFWFGFNAGQSWDQENAVRGWQADDVGPNQHRHYPYTVHRVWNADGNERHDRNLPTLFKSQGVTTAQALTADRLTLPDQQQTKRNDWSALTAKLQYAFDPTMTLDFAPLMKFCPASKPDSDLDKIGWWFNPSQYIAPGPGPYTFPMVSAHYRVVLDDAGDEDSAMTYTPSEIHTRPVKWLDDIEVGEDLMWSRAFSVNSHYGDRNILYGGENVDHGAKPLVYDSLASRLDAMQTALYGYLGLGFQMGGANNGGYDLAQNYRIASSRNWLPEDALSTVFQAGQGARVFAYDPQYTHLNKVAAAVGAITPIDPLVGDATNDADDALGGTFIGGPASYKLRDGTVVDHDSVSNGWGFFATHSPENMTPRKWESGLAQAAMVRDSLPWRMAMIKTSATVIADMFNYDFKAPWIANTQAGGRSVHNHWSRRVSDETDWRDSVGVTALSPFYDASLAQDPTAEARVNKDSYGVGALPNADALEPPHAPYWNAGENLDHGDSQGAHNLAKAEEDGGAWASPLKVQVDYSRGPWGRFEAVRRDDGGDDRFSAGINPLDTWQNRCTVARLRYHIGDYYPGYQGINALVQTLMLYVRFDPLPLVHWATLPKHQHPVVRESVSALNGIEELLQYVKSLPSISHLLHNGTGAPLFPPLGPRGESEHRVLPYDAQVNDPDAEGDIDWRDDPFPSRYQPFVHWHHPNMRYLRAPYGGDGAANGIYGSDPSGKKWPVYAEWGERSLIVPAITYQPAVHDSASNVLPPNAPGWHSNENPGADLDPVTGISRLGSHQNGTDGSGFNITLSSGDVVAMPNESAFPFVPVNGDDLAAEQFAGIPSPVFLPAFHRSLATDANQTTNKLFTVLDDNLEDDYLYFPQVDRMQDSDSWDDEAGASFPWGKGGSSYGRAGNGGWVSAFDWTMPVLRVHLRTSTVAAILNMFRGSLSMVFGDLPDRPTVAAADHSKFGTIADSATDTTFLGDLGCSVAIHEDSGKKARTFYASPLLFSMPVRKSTGDANRWGEPHFNSDYDGAIHDAFQLYENDVEAAHAETAHADWLPLINTFKALYNAGLAQKLLWNCSFRVLHSRPGGGYRPGHDNARTMSSPPKSLTELFIVRNRRTGTAVPMAAGPAEWNKPYLHFPSIHPAAGGGAGPFNAHPNHAKLGHLYPMISDTLGSAFEGVGDRDDLWSLTGNGPSSMADHRVTAAEFAVDRYGSGVQGDAYAADPFDSAIASALAAAAGEPENYRAAATERLHENSGIEIDLFNELNFVRNNAAAHGLDTVGLGGLRWTSLMPEAKDLVAPGDHEILFVLYTGGYGHRMVSRTVPDMYNPAFCGCRLTATIEVNRPNEKTPSTGDGTGEHYGESIETWHGLGHS